MQLRSITLVQLCVLVLTTYASLGCSAEVDTGSVAQASEALSNKPIAIPDVLAAPSGNRLAFRWSAKGVQMYTCSMTAAGGYAWTFVAPDADLYQHRQLVGAHYAGPTWEALDGSTVVGAKVASLAVDATAVPWLLLKAVSNTGHGRMTHVTFVQRLQTTGGIAPALGCDGAHVGAHADVPYTAFYYFYKPEWTHEHDKD